MFGCDYPALMFEMTIDRRRAPGFSDRVPAKLFHENAEAYSPNAAPEIN